MIQIEMTVSGKMPTTCEECKEYDCRICAWQRIFEPGIIRKLCGLKEIIQRREYNEDDR